MPTQYWVLATCYRVRGRLYDQFIFPRYQRVGAWQRLDATRRAKLSRIAAAYVAHSCDGVTRVSADSELS